VHDARKERKEQGSRLKDSMGSASLLVRLLPEVETTQLLASDQTLAR
jgi:hypothetical protein